MAAVRMICAPVVCIVQPTAYMTVPTRSAVPVEQMISETRSNSSTEQPAMRATTSGV